MDVRVFEGFDYVALGHIHKPQSIGSDRIRYCGSPLKYSFSEAAHHKSLTVAELGEKGSLTVRTVPLVPLRDMAELKGSYNELMSRSFYEGTSYREDYVHITLTDENDVPNAMAKLRVVYRNLTKLDYDNARTRHMAQFDETADAEQKDPLTLFSEFYEKQNGVKPNEEQTKLLTELIKSIWEGEA